MKAWLLTALLLASGVSHAGEWPRVIEHAHGATELAAPPQRVVSLDVGTFTDSLLALGLPPVGSITYGLAPPDSLAAWPPAIAEQAVAADIATVGGSGNLDLEVIAAMRPDLILAPGYYGKRIHERLSLIAPTVSLGWTLDFKAMFRAIAEAVGREQQAQTALDEYHERTVQLRARIGGTEIAVVRPRQQVVWMYGPPANVALADAGLKLQPIPEGSSINPNRPGVIGELSLERLPAIEAPHIFMILYNLDHHAGLEGYLEGPMWHRLPAVQRGNVYGVEGIAWTNHGPIGALRMLEEAAAALDGSKR